MVSFSEEEQDALNGLASSLPPALRADFLQLVANKFAAYPKGARAGPGLVHRLAAEAQRDFKVVGRHAWPTRQVGGKYR